MSHGRGGDWNYSKPWSKACREKSAEVKVPKARVPTGKDRTVQRISN